MARRKEFKNIANGLICSFVSRNNDVYGYWGIGKLYSHMLKSKTMTIEINILDIAISPNNNEFMILINSFYKRLISQIQSRKLNINFLKSAKIVLNGYTNDSKSSLGQFAPNRLHCSFIITDDLNKNYIVEKDVWCREHNPNRELKSTRKYE
jgi:hypothetical protein